MKTKSFVLISDTAHVSVPSPCTWRHAQPSAEGADMPSKALCVLVAGVQHGRYLGVERPQVAGEFMQSRHGGQRCLGGERDDECAVPDDDFGGLAIKKLVAKKSGRSMNDIWWTQEVIGDNAEAAEIQPRNYLKTGQVNEFQYAYRLKSLFSNSLAGGSLSIKDIPQNITDSGKASVFVTNWDTERNNMTLTYKDGDAYRLANAFMLAYPYGTPNVFSGYEFHDTDSGASGATATSVPDIDCSKDSGWSCTERWPDVHGMVGWHNVAGDAPLSDWQDDGDNMIAFGRGGRAFIAINNSVRTRTVTYHTALPAGEYCDVYASADCSGSVHVRFDGDATLTVPAGSAVAFHIAATPYTVRQ